MFIDPRVMLLACHLQPSDVVADFGAGSGFVARALAALVPQGTVYAIEINRDMLPRIARDAEEHHLTNLHVVWGDVELVGGSTLKAESVNFVVMSNILFQLEDRAGALAEALRVVKPGGRLLIVDWQESFGGLGPTPQSVVTESVAEALALKVGFTKNPTSAIPAGEHHYALLFQKPA